MSTEPRPAPTAPASRTWTVELRYAGGTMTDTVTAPTALGAVARLTAVLALSPEDVTAAAVTAA